MYAIVKSKSGHFYTSMVFGYFCKITATDDYQQYLESVHNQYYLVLSEDKICVAITDHGDGMTEEVQKHIFEKFYQGDYSRKTEGNGLGLALVKRIMDLCKGSVSVCSIPSQGATFVVELLDHK